MPRSRLARVISRVYETVLYAEDVATAHDFYRDVLGLRPTGLDELAATFRLDDGGMLLVFAPQLSSQPGRRVPSHGTTGAGHVAFSVEKLEDWRERLRTAGVELEREVEWNGGRSIYVRDPAGNSVELVEGDIWPT
jgi:catechol 2,3-dioxygenase-like lactoylglutathione lyase family enzyme